VVNEGTVRAPSEEVAASPIPRDGRVGALMKGVVGRLRVQMSSCDQTRKPEIFTHPRLGSARTLGAATERGATEATDGGLTAVGTGMLTPMPTVIVVPADIADES